MATPTKALTYLTTIARSGAMPRGVATAKLQAAVKIKVYQAPPFWRPLVLTLVRRGVFPRGVCTGKLVGMISVKKTLFWRERPGRPAKGQLWPRTR